jgi:transposase
VATVKKKLAEPIEIVDEEHEQIYQRVAAVDVGKEFGMACLRVSDSSRPGRRKSRVWMVKATAARVLGLADELVAERVEKVTLESTSDYWRIWYYLLEDRGLDVQLVNARDVKNVPGRPKTDTHDAVWLARLTEKGMLRPSFVPPPAFRELRDYTRMRADLTRDRIRAWQRIEKLLEDALVKVSVVASKMTTKSVRDMLDALVAGERDPRVLAGLARGRMKVRYHQLVEAFTGSRFDAHHAELLGMLLELIDAFTARIDILTRRIDDLIAALPAAGPQPGPGDAGDRGDEQDGGAEAVTPSVLQRLDEIPGIATHTAQTIIAEVGLDMSRFPTAGHLVSWAKLSPRIKQSSSKSTTAPVGKGNPYLRAALGEAAAAAARTDTFLGDRYRRLVRRRGKPKALVAVARSILVIAWYLLNDPNLRFHDLGADYHTLRIDTKRKATNHIRQLEALGFIVTLTKTEAAQAA